MQRLPSTQLLSTPECGPLFAGIPVVTSHCIKCKGIVALLSSILGIVLREIIKFINCCFVTVKISGHLTCVAAAVPSFCNYSNHSLHSLDIFVGSLRSVCPLFLALVLVFAQSYSSRIFSVGIFGMFQILAAIRMLATSIFISSFSRAYQEVQPVRFVQSGQTCSQRYRRSNTFVIPPSHMPKVSFLAVYAANKAH